MTENEILLQYIDSVVEMDLEKAKKMCQDALAEGIHPYKIIQEGITKAASIISEKFEAEIYFIPELIMAGEIIKETMKILDPQIKEKDETNTLGKVIIGTGKGDLHDIGKNIVKMFLEAEGFRVVDLGVDVGKEKVLEAIRKEKPEILALSTLVSSTMLELKNIMRALEEAKLRNQVKVIIGGAPITQEFVDDIAADAFAHNAIEGVNICKRWVKH
ncbi:MAG: B12-binding domain-containing protein [Promethearchaeota archaeon]